MSESTSTPSSDNRSVQHMSSRYIAPVLGALGTLGPLATDMYLPGMPQIASDLAVDAGAIQFSLMTFFAGLMVGQLFYGPLSDRMGRKRMIYVGLAMFVIASLGCALATSAGQLTGWRFVQGLGGSIGMVIGLAMIRDVYTGRAAAGLVAMMMVVQGIAPIVGPLLGTAILAVAPWQAMFVLLAVCGIACAALTALVLPETRLPELRAISHPSAALRNYARLLAGRHFISFAGVTALAMGGFFAYLAGSSFVFISVYELSPMAYSLLFAVNAFGLMIGAQISPRLLGRFRPHSIIRAALATYAVAALALVAMEWSGGANLIALSVLLFVVVTAMAFVLPIGSVMALESYGAIAGTAAALMGALNFGAGTVASFAVGAAADGTARPMLVVIAVCSLFACLIAYCALPKVDHSQPENG